MDGTLMDVESRFGDWPFWLFVLFFYAVTFFFTGKLVSRFRNYRKYEIIWCVVTIILIVYSFLFLGIVKMTSFPKDVVSNFFKPNNQSMFSGFGNIIFSILAFPILIFFAFIINLPKTIIKNPYYLLCFMVIIAIFAIALYNVCIR